ncbi:SubName: Full=Uncharacterized protein {ECO:0000313/EMBL:CCA68175.1} [Serendipita indica DSM 11827]|nr:SubName: Full=Uncharacterized protein {ECO:0000313/EMBL:CCA68175.1} [Serendipita indica DSM 11827]
MASPYEKNPASPSSPSGYFDVQRKPNEIEVQSPTSDRTFMEKVRVVDGSSSSPPSCKDQPPPEQKYTRQWFKQSWNSAIHVGRLPRAVYGAIGLCIVIIWFGVMLAFNKDEEKYKGNGGRSRSSQTHGSSVPQTQTHGLNQNGNGLLGLSGSYIQFDAMKHTLTITWSGIYRRDNKSDWVPLGDRYDSNSASFYVPFGIYRDVDALPWDFLWNSTSKEIAQNGTFFLLETSSDPDLTVGYMYRVDNLTAPPVGYVGSHKWDSFDTDIGFVQTERGNVWNAPLVSYPFDVWEGSITFSASDTFQNTYDYTPGGNVFGLDAIQMKDSTLNWRFSFDANNTCVSQKRWDWTDLSTFSDACNMEITFTARRPPVVKFAAVAAVIVNWTSALFIFVLTCEAIVMRRRYMLEGTDILSVCFTALFALPTIRALLPGAPEYGATLDLVGVLPCTVLVALCTVAVSIAKLNKRKHAAMENQG